MNSFAGSFCHVDNLMVLDLLRLLNVIYYPRVHDIAVILDSFSFKTVNGLHCCFKQATDEPFHVRDGTIDQELLDEVLIRERLN